MEIDTIAYIGRFQPFHNGHLSTLLRGLQLAKQVVVVLGSANKPSTLKNPWNASDRQEMIRSSIPNDIYPERVKFVRADDYPGDDSGWTNQIRSLIIPHTSNGKFELIGSNKDESTYYFKFFPDIYLHQPLKLLLSGTEIRKYYFNGASDWETMVPGGSQKFLLDFKNTEQYDILRKGKYGQSDS